MLALIAKNCIGAFLLPTMHCYVGISFIFQLASVSAVLTLPLFFDKDVEKVLILLCFAAAENLLFYCVQLLLTERHR